MKPNILELVKEAQMQLRSAQVNWQEDCYFECDAILSQIIDALEPAPLDKYEWLPPVSITQDGKVLADWTKPE